MRTIAVANQKGGCGKTTVSINLAACLAREGRRTLLIDMDPQGHCALGLAVPEEQIEISVYDVLMQPPVAGNKSHETGSAPTDITRCIWQITANFDLAPATTALAQFEPLVAGLCDGEDRLAEALSAVSDRYDFAIIDCPPHIGTLTRNALHAACEVIIPVDTGYFSLQGLSKQLDTIDTIRSGREQPLEIRVLANLYDVRTKLGREILNELKRKFGSVMCSTFINFNTKLREGASFGQPITEYDPTSMGYRDFIRLAREVISTGGPEMAPTTLLRQADSLVDRAQSLLATTKPLFPAKNGSHGTNGNSSNGNGTHTETEKASAEPINLIDDDTATTIAEPEPVSQTEVASQTETTVSEALAQAQALREAVTETAPVNHEAIQKKIDRIYGVETTDNGVVFRTFAPSAQKVHVAGDFNNWSAEATPMITNGEVGTFHAMLPLSPGRYRYRYVIDGKWVSDPNNQHCETNPFGDQNSIVEVAG